MSHNNKPSDERPGEPDKLIKKEIKDKQDKSVSKPILFRSQSLSNCLTPKFGAQVTRSGLGLLLAGQNGAPTATGPSAGYIQGSAQSQRYPIGKQPPEILRKNSHGRYGSTPVNTPPGSSSTSPSQTNRQADPSSPTTGSVFNAIYQKSNQLKSKISPADKMKNEQFRAHYKVQEKAYVSRMNNDFTDDYTTKTIDANYDGLDPGEGDLESSDSEDSEYTEDSELDDGGEVLEEQKLMAKRGQQGLEVQEVKQEQPEGDAQSEASTEMSEEEEESEFQRIFEEDNEEEEEDNTIEYATELGRILPDDFNADFKIDDLIIYPLIKSQLKPQLLEDKNFLERFEWQIMLRLVVNGDIVTAEKQKMMKKLSFGVFEDNIDLAAGHGSEVSRGFFVSLVGESLWLEIKARKYSRAIFEQKKILGYSRSLMDEVIDEIMTFEYDSEPVERQFYCCLAKGKDSVVDAAVLELEDYKSAFKLTKHQQHILGSLLYKDANRVVQELLDKFGACEELWMTHNDMYKVKPVLRSKEFQEKYEALISWLNIINSLYREKGILISKFRVGDPYDKDLLDSKDVTRSNSTSGNSDGGAAGSDSGLSGTTAGSEASRVASADSDEPLAHSEISNDEYYDTHESPISRGSRRSSLVGPVDIEELDIDFISESLLTEKNLNDIFQNKIFKVIHLWSQKAKQTYLVFQSKFEELKLPSYLNILVELIQLPTNLMREIIRKRLSYAKNLTGQTLMGIDQTIIDFKVIIKLSFQIKQNYMRFLEDCPLPSNLKNSYESLDRILTDFLEYMLVLFHRKLLDSSRNDYSFTTYKEADFLVNEWPFLKNMGYFVDSFNSGFKISRNFLLLVSRILNRFLRYLDYQLVNPVVSDKLLFTKWYSNTFDSYNNIRRSLTLLNNSMLKACQNSMIVNFNFNKEIQIAKMLLHFLKRRNHILVRINGKSDMYDIFYGKSKKIRTKKILVYCFVSEELHSKSDKDILDIFQGGKLGCDAEKPNIDDLKGDDSGLVGADDLPSGFPGKRPEDIPLPSHNKTEINTERPVVPATYDDPKTFEQEKSYYVSPIGYALVFPIARPINWNGKVRDIELNEEELQSFPQLVTIKYGNALLIAEGSPYNLAISKFKFINNLKSYYVDETETGLDYFPDIKNPINSTHYSVQMFDQKTKSEKTGSASPFSEEEGTSSKLLEIIKSIKIDRLCSLLQIQKEYIKFSKNYHQITMIILDKGLALKNRIMVSFPKNEIDLKFLEIVNNLFYILRDSSLRSLKTIEPSMTKEYLDHLIRVSIEWIKTIVDSCVATEQKTFRWCVSALEFAVLVFQKFNMLLLTDEQFSVLKSKVAGCLSLLISHFDIMGARSNKADKVLLSISKLQRTVIQKDHTLAEHKNTELNEKVVQLDKQLSDKLLESRRVGRVLDNEKSENKFLANLSKSFAKFSSRWKKGDYLGGGTFGLVYTAYDIQSGNVMAVKEVKFPNRQSVTKIGNIIKDEMTVLEMLDHPNIIHYYGVEVHSDKVCLFMEYCEQGSLAQLLDNEQVVEEGLMAWYTFQMLEGLSYLHLNNITHRDVKPENILLNRVGVIKFVDFGGAKVIASTGRTRSINPARSLHGNKTGIFGTPMYMSPESITGVNEVLGSSDVWALGCCVLQMCTGKRPWSKLDNEYAIMFHIASGNSPELPTGDEMSPGGINFLRRCFEPNPERRVTSAELLNDPWLADARDWKIFGEEEDGNAKNQAGWLKK